MGRRANCSGRQGPGVFSAGLLLLLLPRVRGGARPQHVSTRVSTEEAVRVHTRTPGSPQGFFKRMHQSSKNIPTPHKVSKEQVPYLQCLDWPKQAGEPPETPQAERGRAAAEPQLTGPLLTRRTRPLLPQDERPSEPPGEGTADSPSRRIRTNSHCGELTAENSPRGKAQPGVPCSWRPAGCSHHRSLPPPQEAPQPLSLHSVKPLGPSVLRLSPWTGQLTNSQTVPLGFLSSETRPGPEQCHRLQGRRSSRSRVHLSPSGGRSPQPRWALRPARGRLLWSEDTAPRTEPAHQQTRASGQPPCRDTPWAEGQSHDNTGPRGTSGSKSLSPSVSGGRDSASKPHPGCDKLGGPGSKAPNPGPRPRGPQRAPSHSPCRLSASGLPAPPAPVTAGPSGRERNSVSGSAPRPCHLHGHRHSLSPN